MRAESWSWGKNESIRAGYKHPAVIACTANVKFCFPPTEASPEPNQSGHKLVKFSMQGIARR